MARPLYATLALTLALAVSSASQSAPQSDWARLLKQDARISFNPARTELAAITAIEAGGLDQGTRAAALFALGASGSKRGRALIVEALASENLQERCAAVLALGELGVGVSPLLERLRGDSAPLVAECALLALMRTGRWAAADYVEAVSESGDAARAETASKLLLFATDAPASEATEASALLLKLRWDAGRHFGLIDGRAWEVALIERLAEDEAFLKGFVLNAAASSVRPGSKDHFRSLAESERTRAGAASEQAVCAALRAMPGEVPMPVEAGLWNPDWGMMLEEIRERDLEGATIGILRLAKEIPSMRYRAMALLAKAGDSASLAPLRDEIESGRLGPMQLIYSAEALGYVGGDAAAPLLRAMRQHPSEDVVAAAQVQLAKMGDVDAAAFVSEHLGDRRSSVHRQVVDWVSAGAESPALSDLLSQALPELKGVRALHASIALSQQGNPEARDVLRELLSAGLPAGKIGARAVEALEGFGGVEDLAYLRHQFPYGKDEVVNEALALALYRARDPRVLGLIRAGIWDSPGFDQSVLASGLLIDMAGVRALIDEARYEPMLEADTPNARYRAAKYPRRVGYALGLWGGLEALDELNSEVSDVREGVRHGALLGALASRTH